ncbi:MAG: hypothetical protein Q9218_001630 [Villophora microphyllina]
MPERYGTSTSGLKERRRWPSTSEQLPALAAQRRVLPHEQHIAYAGCPHNSSGNSATSAESKFSWDESCRGIRGKPIKASSGPAVYIYCE